MTTFSPSTISNAVAATASDTSSSLTYHHLQSASSATHNHHHYHPHHHQANSTTASSEENPTHVHTIHDAHHHHSYENAASYVNGAEFALCLPSNHGTHPFEMVTSTSSSPSHFNHDPLMRHFFHYRPNDANFPGNYYSNMSTGSFVNAFDYPYANISPASAAVLGSEPSISHPGFAPPSSSSQTHHPQHHHRSFVHSYLPYQHHPQPIRKQTGSFTAPLQAPVPPPLIQHQPQQRQQQQRPATQQQQNVYPWMKRIHHSCGESIKSLLRVSPLSR